MGRYDALTQLEAPKPTSSQTVMAPPSQTPSPSKTTSKPYKSKKSKAHATERTHESVDPQTPLLEQPMANPVSSKTPLQNKNDQILHDTMTPRHHDTIIPFNHDTTTPREGSDIFEVVRKSVKQIGKEAATHRFTLEEKNAFADIEYTYKRQGIRTSENEITRIAINYFIEDYRQNGEDSLLANILKRLNS